MFVSNERCFSLIFHSKYILTHHCLVWCISDIRKACLPQHPGLWPVISSLIFMSLLRWGCCMAGSPDLLLPTMMANLASVEWILVSTGRTILSNYKHALERKRFSCIILLYSDLYCIVIWKCLSTMYFQFHVKEMQFYVECAFKTITRSKWMQWCMLVHRLSRIKSTVWSWCLKWILNEKMLQYCWHIKLYECRSFHVSCQIELK